MLWVSSVISRTIGSESARECAVTLMGRSGTAAGCPARPRHQGGSGRQQRRTGAQPREDPPQGQLQALQQAPRVRAVKTRRNAPGHPGDRPLAEDPRRRAADIARDEMHPPRSDRSVLPSFEMNGPVGATTSEIAHVVGTRKVDRIVSRRGHQVYQKGFPRVARADGWRQQPGTLYWASSAPACRDRWCKPGAGHTSDESSPRPARAAVRQPVEKFCASCGAALGTADLRRVRQRR